MTEHWKSIQWFSLAVIAAAIVALISGWYFVVIGLFYATVVVTFVVATEWAREREEQRRHGA
ncbi:MAG: hypothetical protein KC776_18375 [Myxococcales bacterium]|nr:hypothetical protein [Myxococcales bacterium]MCB9579291.1 hypothetical protein [Polyangiaceae bacterium]